MKHLVTIPADGCALEYSNDGVTWYELQDIADISASAGGFNETETETFEDGAGKVPTGEVVQNVTIAIPNFLPHLAAWQEVDQAHRDKELLYWRITTQEESIYSGNDVVISALGVITFNDAPAEYGVGTVIRIGAADYVIDSIGAEIRTRSVVAVPVANAAYSLVVPALRMQFRGWVKSITNFNLLPAQAVASSLELMLNAPLPKWSIV